MSFVKRLLSVTFILGGGKKFVESGQNTVKLEGLRMKTKCVKAGGPSMGTAQLQIYGMTKSIMNQLSTLGMLVTMVQRNSVILEAGDAISGMGVVFQGTITAAWTDFSAAPDVCFHVEAHTGLAEAVAPAAPLSFKGGTDVAVIMSGLATKMGLAFENTGVNAKLPTSYYPGSARDQAKAVAQHAGINWVIDNGKLAIWPKNKHRGGLAVLISPKTGLVGYPEYTAQGIKFSVLYNPSITFGGPIVMESDLKPACGTWSIFAMDHDLSALVPNGDWFTRCQAYNPLFPMPVAT